MRYERNSFPPKDPPKQKYSKDNIPITDDNNNNDLCPLSIKENIHWKKVSKHDHKIGKSHNCPFSNFKEITTAEIINKLKQNIY